MRTSPSGLVVGPMALLGLLAVLAATVGLSAWGWVAGLTCGVLANATVARAFARCGGDGPGPADLVTLSRVTLTCGVAALAVAPVRNQPALGALVGLATVALVLDAVDGWVARRTLTASMLGARLDGEVDAFLIAVLSVEVARSFGWWVLAIGGVRYAFAIAGWALVWMRGQLPFRYWRKVVTAAQGIVLTVAAAQVLPTALTYLALGAASGLLAESFGRDVWWLWRRRGRRSVAERADRRTAHASAGS